MEPNQAKVEANKLLKWLDDGGAEMHTRPGSERLPGPLEWIPRTSQFQNWLGDGPPTLLLVGRPGSGKTIAASLVVDTLLRQDNLERRVGVAFLHVGTGQKKRNAMQLSRSLLYQLGQQLASSYMRTRNPPRMEDVLEPLRERNPYPSMANMVSQMLPEVIGKFDRVYVVVDELDQMTENRGQLRSNLVSLGKNDLRLFLTTCHSPNTRGRLHKAPQILIGGANTGEDLDTYVTQRLADLPRFVRNRPMLQTLVKERVIQNANGLILAAKLLMDGLMTTRGAEIKPRLTSTGVLLGELYNRFIARIQELDDAQQNFAKETLAWLLLVKRPMREAEMRHILRRDQNATRPDSDDAPDYKHVLELCEDFNILVNVRGGNCLDVHPPASDFLLRTLDSWCPDAKVRVARRCLEYLILIEFRKGPCKTDIELESRLQNYALYGYIVQHWTVHLQGLDHLLMLFIREFLMSERNVASAAQVMSVLRQKPSGPGYSQRFDTPGSGFHLAAQLGLTSVLTSLVGVEQQWVAMVDLKGRTPLWCAIEHRQRETMKFLSRVDRTTFTLLLEQKQTTLAETLLMMAGPDIKDLRSNTALHIGVIRQDLEIMQLSLKSRVNIDAKGADGYSAIKLAIASKQSEAIHLLLKNSASTAQLTVYDWLTAFNEEKNYSDSPSIIELVEYDLGKTDVALFRVNDFQLVDPTTRRLLIYPGSKYWPTSYLDESSPYAKDITYLGDQTILIFQWYLHASIRPYQGPCYSVKAFVPSLATRQRDGPFMFSLQLLMISWSMGTRSDQVGNDRWISIDHISTLVDGSMPSSGMDLFNVLVKELTASWTLFCVQVDNYLLQCRLDVLKWNGEKRDLITRLLEDATSWIKLRRRHDSQVKAIRKFCKTYENRRYEDRASELVVSTIDDFADSIRPRFDGFDAESSALIQLEFNLTSIREAQRSTSLNISLKRLSWITFIFLPLTFVAGLFGMNVNILADNPPWWWYLVFISVTLSLTMLVWLICRKFPELEDTVDAKFPWLKPNRAGQKSGDVESDLLSQEKKDK